MNTLIQVVIAYFAQVIASFSAAKTWMSARLAEVSASIATETQNRVNQFNSLNSSLAAETQLRTDQDANLAAAILQVDTDLRAIVGTNSTSFQSMLNNAINALKDTSVRDRIIHPFVDGGTIDFNSFSFQADGKTAIYFVGPVTAEASVSNLPANPAYDAAFKAITAGDIYHVTTDEGSIVEIVKVEDVTKPKFVEIDAAIASEAQARTTLAGTVTQQGNDLAALKAQFEAATANLNTATLSLFPN